MTLNPNRKPATPHSKLSLMLLLMGALLTMGAKLVQQPIERFESIAGTWNGSGVNWLGINVPTDNMRFPLILTINQDGSFDIEGGYGTGKGAMKIQDGKIRFKVPPHGHFFGALYESNRKRLLKGTSTDGAITWQVKEKKSKNKGSNKK